VRKAWCSCALTNRFLCAAWGTALETSFNVAGCFDEGAVFNIWVNAKAATHSYMAPYAITIDSSASWCQFDFGGAVDTISTSFSTGSALTPVSCSTISLSKNNAAPYVVNYYNVWQSPTCGQNNNGGNINLDAPVARE
jgi:hypothetical protein